MAYSVKRKHVIATKDKYRNKRMGFIMTLRANIIVLCSYSSLPPPSLIFPLGSAGPLHPSPQEAPLPNPHLRLLLFKAWSVKSQGFHLGSLRYHPEAYRVCYEPMTNRWRCFSHSQESLAEFCHSTLKDPTDMFVAHHWSVWSS